MRVYKIYKINIKFLKNTNRNKQCIRDIEAETNSRLS